MWHDISKQSGHYSREKKRYERVISPTVDKTIVRDMTYLVDANSNFEIA